MATKKKAAKRPVGRPPLKKASKVVSSKKKVIAKKRLKLTNLAYFTAYRHGKKLGGQVYIIDGNYYLLVPTGGDNYSNNYGWPSYILLGEASSIKKSMADTGITKFEIVTDKSVIQAIESTKLPNVSGYGVSLRYGVYYFGCGDVKLTEDQIRSYIRIKELNISDDEIDCYKEAEDQIGGQGRKVDLTEANALLQAIKNRQNI